ncbi:MAG: membrane dipeptidase [Deltaproteobacteria bacterium]|nr:membrane dipeptidase [Deltaproteobacteria bacterium]
MGTLDDKDARRLELDDGARRVHEQSLVVDLHVDSILQQRFFGYDLAEEHRPGGLLRGHGARALPFLLARAGALATGQHQPFFNHADMPRMRRGGYNGVGLGIHYWPRSREAGWTEINRQIDYFHRLLAEDAQLVQARGPQDIEDTAQNGKLAAFLALEGVHALGAAGPKHATTRLDRLETLFERGVRYVTLAHFSANDAVTHCFGPGANPDAGLTPYGRDLIKKVYEVGLLVDVAHVSPQGVLEVCELSQGPVIASHTGLAGTYPSRDDANQARNLRDEGALAIAHTGGVIGLMLAPQFLCEHADSQHSFQVVAHHLAHGIELLDSHLGEGSRFFALGSDLDGWIHSLFDEMDDAADLPRLTSALLAAGIPKDVVASFLGANFLRVWRHAMGQEPPTQPVASPS